jgi:adenylate cyclase
MRKSGSRLRITAQLLEAETGAHLWADKFDGALEDVFELQDQINDRVVGIVEPSLRKSEIERSGTDDATALAFAAFAITILSKDHEAALSAIERALSLNASCATALYFGALTYAFAGQPAAAVANANRALRLSPFDPFAYFAHGALGAAALHESRYDEAATHYAKAVQGNPRFSTLYFFHAASLALAGRADEARPIVRRLLELEPSFRSRMIFEVGYEPTDRFLEGARLLGLPE